MDESEDEPTQEQSTESYDAVQMARLTPQDVRVIRQLLAQNVLRALDLARSAPKDRSTASYFLERAAVSEALLTKFPEPGYGA